ncbi:MAG: hypothetical protein LBH58_09250 [Tannerellaceae bacterium]|jgi:hypothetical protein|nr:hypothetical protein [Tannerellaceae bacterium]
MLQAEIVVAGVLITFWTSHQADIDCVNDFFRYHLYDKDKKPVPEKYHDVIIVSSKEKTAMPTIPVTFLLRWNGTINARVPINWYNAGTDEDLITIGDDITITHFPKRKLTRCYLSESKTRLFKAQRPRLTCYIFFLLHSILSMHGKYCLHSSCIAKDKHAYLFLGKSGEGKSTISYLLARQGYEYMGDDLVFISEDAEGKLIVDAFLSKIKLLNKKFEMKEAVDIIGKYQLNHAYRRELGAIVKLQRTSVSHKSSLIPATDAETFGWLINSGNNIKIQYQPRLWMDICEKATSFPAYTLMFADKEYFEHELINDIL